MSIGIAKKISEAQARIMDVVVGGICCPHQLYAAYSGGKDSKAVLHLARTMIPGITVVHNGHPGEDIGHENVLCVLPPKAENVPQFLKLVDLQVQLDGTRRAEDKTVIFDGVEIHRSEMPGYSTTNGVFGLHCVFPIWDWSDDEVMEYLEIVRCLSS